MLFVICIETRVKQDPVSKMHWQSIIPFLKEGKSAAEYLRILDGITSLIDKEIEDVLAIMLGIEGFDLFFGFSYEIVSCQPITLKP